MREDSTKAKKVIKDHMLSNEIHISDKLIWSLATARQKYQTFLENSERKNVL